MRKYAKFLLIFIVILTVISPGLAIASTKTARGTVNYVISGVRVAIHTNTTWWSYNGTDLLSSPKGIENDQSVFDGCQMQGEGKKWDWYNTGYHGTCRSNAHAIFYHPNSGTQWTSRIWITGKYDGNWSWSHVPHW